MAVPNIIRPNSPVSETESQSCELCYDTGWERVGNTGVRPCSICRNRSKYAVLLEAARIPERYIDCTLDNYVPQNDKQQHVIGFCKSYVNSYHNNCKGVLFLGPCGVGKTHLAVALIKEIMRHKNVRCLFYDLRDLLKEIQDAYNSGGSEKEIVTPICKVDVLVLDELGATRPTDWVHETITHIINTRYNDKKITILTSNYLDNPVPTKEDTRNGNRVVEETLSQRIGMRLRSRLYEMCWLMDIKGYDYRDSRNRPQDSSSTEKLSATEILADRVTSEVLDAKTRQGTPLAVTGLGENELNPASPVNQPWREAPPIKAQTLVQQRLLELESVKDDAAETPSIVESGLCEHRQHNQAKHDQLRRIIAKPHAAKAAPNPQPLASTRKRLSTRLSNSITAYNNKPTKYNK